MRLSHRLRVAQQKNAGDIRSTADWTPLYLAARLHLDCLLYQELS